jgi:hypothetical protein
MAWFMQTMPASQGRSVMKQELTTPHDEPELEPAQAQRAALLFSDRVRLELLLDDDFEDDEYPEAPSAPGE